MPIVIVFVAAILSIYLFSPSFSGLPHAHIVVWVAPDDKPRPEQIDECVVAELPDPDAEPELHAIASSKMLTAHAAVSTPGRPV